MYPIHTFLLLGLIYSCIYKTEKKTSFFVCWRCSTKINSFNQLITRVRQKNKKKQNVEKTKLHQLNKCFRSFFGFTKQKKNYLLLKEKTSKLISEANEIQKIIFVLVNLNFCSAKWYKKTKTKGSNRRQKLLKHVKLFVKKIL